MNTTVTVTYTNGSTREFVASDSLEELINDGEMFSISTMHSDMGVEIEQQLSKMYVGNPMAALGNMMMMRKNAENINADDFKLLKNEDMTPEKLAVIMRDSVTEILTSCIKMLSDECISHQSGMVKADGEVLTSLNVVVNGDFNLDKLTVYNDDEEE